MVHVIALIGEALVVANVGPLIDPCNLGSWDPPGGAQTCRRPESLFSHSSQTLVTQSLLSNYMTSSKGILGRTFSALAKDGFASRVYTVTGNANFT